MLRKKDRSFRVVDRRFEKVAIKYKYYQDYIGYR